MEARIRQELDTLQKMVGHWKDDYIRLIDPLGGNDYLTQDFRTEIEEHLYPYIRRMYECGYITKEELSEFFDRCLEEVRGFREKCP